MHSPSVQVLQALYAGDRDGAEAAAAGNDLDVFAAAALGDAGRTDEELQRDPQLAHATTTDGFTALHLAAFFGTPAAVAALLRRGADPTAVAANPMSVTPLHSAVAHRSAAAVTLLLEGGAPVDAKQSGGFTALHAAAMHADRDIVDSLLAHGADPTIADDAGLTAADHAERGGHPALASALRDG
jgi:ankyrin repeat protein